MWGHFMTKSLLGASLVAFSLISTAAIAGPTGATVEGGTGNATVTYGTKTIINQKSKYVKINWSDFSSAAGDTIEFTQPNSKAIAVNRVTSGKASNLLGTLNANGRVVIMNDAGITFGAGSKVNVNSLYATTAKTITNPTAGNLRNFAFAGAEKPIVNNGEINIGEGGALAFFAPSITNTGKILGTKADMNFYSTEGGKLNLGSTVGDTVLDTISATDTSTEAVKSQPINFVNSGIISNGSGRINIRTLNSKTDTINDIVNLSGVIDATRLAYNDTGSVVIVESRVDLLLGSTGKITANAKTNGDGGSITVAGTRDIGLARSSVVSANGGATSATGVSTANSGGSIKITKFGVVADTGNKFVAAGLINADAGKDSTANNGAINLGITGNGNLVVDSNAVISSTGFKTAGSGNGGRISVASDGVTRTDTPAITIKGELNTNATGNGDAGQVTITSKNDLLFETTAKVKADAAAIGNGGTINVTAYNDLLLKRNSLISANGGTTSALGTSSNNSGGVITITKSGKTTDTGLKFLAQGNITAIGGKDAKVNSGTVTLNTTGAANFQTDTTSIINVSGYQSAGNASAGKININAENSNVVVAGNLLADGSGTGNGGQIRVDVDSTAHNKTADMTAAKITEKSGLKGGNGGTLYFKTDANNGTYTKSNISLISRKAPGTNGVFTTNDGSGDEVVTLP